ncbi:hypothetical protein Pmani_017656 [Petrolisthes manimaculis]|uniref:Metalloendopeptidase OMA1, mitochondrial n=1 Tax=Petrolisthes manimaculis TaxID=1843537 RepID=A0AAE1PLF5_9EUCA|nr:hypothetical protein Pmani_017656 [Petrolisthes manimaculis]
MITLLARSSAVHLRTKNVLSNLTSRCIVRPRLVVQDSVFLSAAKRHIHTSRPRFINPMILAVFRPVSKFLVVIVGRSFRKWWQALPPNKKRLITQHLQRNKGRYVFGSGVMGAASYYYYQSHTTTTLFTGRRRLMLFTPEQLLTLSQVQYETQMEMYGDWILPHNHPYSIQVKRVALRLLQANKDIPQLYNKQWTISVIDLDVINCEVLPSGDIFMFRGMMDLMKNDDQVATVLGHEISHAILEHSGEHLSYGYLRDLLTLVPLAIIWAFLPSDGIAAITHWFTNRVVKVCMQLPHSRTLEMEADTVGLRLAAKACFDIREASAFWGAMDIGSQHDEPPSWLSTHPSNADRQQLLDNLMDEAITIRDSFKCPRLSQKDPRQEVKMMLALKDKLLKGE